MRKILVIKGDQVVTAYNHPDRGPGFPIIASLLMNIDIDEVYVAGTSLFPFLASVNNEFQNTVPGWCMRFSDKKRRHTIELPNKPIGYTGTFFVDYFSIDQKGSSKNKRYPRKRITVINLELFFNKPPLDPELQLEACLALFHVADTRGIKLRPSNGAMGAALLRSMPSYKIEKRHPAPKFINLFSRQYLPGNYYGLSGRFDRKVGFGYYIDQEGSYHAVAKSTKIPHPHSIRARGNYKEALEWNDEVWRTWTRSGDKVFDEILKGRQIGLLLARIYVDQLGRYDKHLYPPWAQKRGKRYVWIWTPELRIIQNDQRLHLDSFMAGFTGFNGDPAINEYGTWALNYHQAHNWTKQYTKGALHAAYGMLAYNSTKKPAIRKYWGGNYRGNPVELPGTGIVQERNFKLKQEYQTSLSNVIGYGVIQAETRTRSLEYAKELHEQGLHVVQIYVDGIFVETDQLPFIREGWRVDSEHTNVSIPRPNAFLSDQVTKLPGALRTEDDEIWLNRRRESRKPLTGLVQV